MDRLRSVTDYLRAHWTNARMNPREREEEVRWYAQLPDPYGPVFAAKLRINLHKELKGK